MQKSRIELIQEINELNKQIESLLSEISILRNMCKDENEFTSRIALQMKNEREKDILVRLMEWNIGG